jgi:hypothetical protein
MGWNWTIFSRISDIVALVAGAAALAPLVWAGREILRAGLSASVPAWLLAAAAVAAFSAGWLVRGRTSSKASGPIDEASDPTLVANVDFGYLSTEEDPMKHRWKLKGVRPALDVVRAPNGSKALCVRPNGDYSLDYPVLGPSSLANEVSFDVMPNPNGVVVLEVSVGNGTSSKPVWLRHEFSRGAPKQDNDQKWTFYLPGEHLRGGWLRIIIPVVDEVRSSFGTDQAGNWELRELSVIGLRRSLSISPISLFRRPSIDMSRSPVSDRASA